jgi:hypothetical protein
MTQLVVDGSRRGMLRTALTGAAASALAGIGIASGAVDATAGKKKRRCKPKPVGTPCETNKDCCCNKNQICSTPCDGSPGVTSSVCCGGKGASCDSSFDCCFNFVCNPAIGKCQEGVC